jgi:hypothetical protein
MMKKIDLDSGSVGAYIFPKVDSKVRKRPAAARVRRIFDVLHGLERARVGVVTPSDLAEQLHIARSSTHRLLAALAAVSRTMCTG